MKNALVTGGSRGIGRAICVELARKGYHVLINYVSNDEAAQETLNKVNEAGSDGELLKFDVGDLEATNRALQAWQETHPGEYIEALVNNAGIRKDNLLIWLEPMEWQNVMNTNLGSFYNVTRALLQPMLTHKKGRIVNMASLSGIKGLPGQTNYSAAKGGLIAATKALAQEVAPRKVEEIKKTIPARRLGEPEEVAALVGFLVSDQAGYITGQVISVNGGLYT